MTVIRSADATVHELHGSRFVSYVAPSRGSGELCAWRLEVAPGTAGVAHRVTREEVLLLLDGELTATIDGTSSVLRPGDVAVVPAGSEFRVDGGPASAWVTTSAGLRAVAGDGSWIAPPWTR